MIGRTPAKPQPTPFWVWVLLPVLAGVSGYVVWLAHPKTWTEVLNIVLAGLFLEVVGLVLALPIGLITGVYRKPARDFGARRRRPYGAVALVMIGLIGALYLFANNVAWIPALGSPDLWRYPPWDIHWQAYWIKQGWGSAVYFAAILGSALLQVAVDHLDRAHQRRAAKARPRPVTLDGN